MRPRGLYKTQRFSVALKGFFKSIQKKKIPWATKEPQGRISNSVSRKAIMSSEASKDLIFHVYKDNKVRAHNLTVDELESLIISKQIKLGEDEIEVLELSKNTDGSY